MSSETIGVVLSGGSGTRFGGALPKQFAKLAGKAVIEYTMDVFENSQDIDRIMVVSGTGHVDRTWELVEKNKWSKVDRVVDAGKERFDSTWSALKALEGLDEDSKILFHDAVRPLVDNRILHDCVAALDEFHAADVIIPSGDTLVEVEDDGCIARIPSRDHMGRGQTPQAFRLGCIRQAYDKAMEAGRRQFTCDCGVVRAMLPHVKVATVPGSEKNFKVTQPVDLFVAEKLLQTRAWQLLHDPERWTGLKGQNIVVFGGSSGIGLEVRNTAIAAGAHVEVASRSHNDVDVCDYQSVSTWLATVAEKLGSIDHVVNSAGFLLKKPLELLQHDDIAKLINVNYTGAVNVAIAAKPYLAASEGTLLNFTSSSYTRGRALYALYSSSNAAIVNLTQALAEEWSDEHIRVNCINPERTATPMRTSNFGQEPADQLLDPQTVAHRTLDALCTDITGIVVDIRKDGR